MIAFARLTALPLAFALATPAMAADIIETGGGFAINDNQSASSEVVIASTALIESLTVSLNIQHTFLGDLIATLSNGTTTITLFDRPGVPPATFGNGLNLNGVYTFDDSAAAALPETPTFDPGDVPEGSYLSQDPLSAFAGQSAAGTWTLTISDNAGGDQGTLESWSLNILTSAVPEPGTWLMMILGFGAIGAGMRHGKIRKASVSYA